MTNKLEAKTEEVVEKKVKKELTREEKKAMRREGMSQQGVLTLPDELKEKGYRYRVCNLTPGNWESYRSAGWEIVTHDMKSGSGSLGRPEVDGRPVDFEVGGSYGSVKAVWIRTPEDNASILDEIRDDMAREQANMIHKSPIPEESRIGSITKET